MKTYWLTVTNEKKSSHSTGSKRNITHEEPISEQNETCSGLDEKSQRLVDWNTDVLLRFLKLVVARKGTCGKADQSDFDWNCITSPGVSVAEEIAEIITLPSFTTILDHDSESLEITEEVEKQLHDYVLSIALLYRDNPFHNFAHASHVTMVSTASSIINTILRLICSQ
jgi:hypothetical protein